MTRIVLDPKKTVEENAEVYFNKSKKSKKKLEGIKKALLLFAQEKKATTKKDRKEEERLSKKVLPRKAEHWYEKFRWFMSSEGILCIGGRDLTQNDILMKKHRDKDDIIFHTETPGSPFFIIKVKEIPPTTNTFEEVAQATASYSKAWSKGTSSSEVFSATAEQFSKTSESGEYVPRGSFVVRGKRTYYTATLAIGIGLQKEKIIGGPVSAIQHHTRKNVIIVQGDKKASDTAKIVKKKLCYEGHVDDIISFLPGGKNQMKK